MGSRLSVFRGCGSSQLETTTRFDVKVDVGLMVNVGQASMN
jgi:hypothetical protein